MSHWTPRNIANALNMSGDKHIIIDVSQWRAASIERVCNTLRGLGGNDGSIVEKRQSNDICILVRYAPAAIGATEIQLFASKTSSALITLSPGQTIAEFVALYLVVGAYGFEHP